MGRTGKRQEMLDGIRAFLRKEPETIEEAVRKDQTLCDAGLAGTQTTVDDYSLCPTCNRVCWHGVCSVCQAEEAQS